VGEILWKIGERIVDLGRHGLVMGVLNVTPDSFSDGGEFFATDKAVEHGLELVAAGADIIDIGGESTRPGAEAVDAKEELRRSVPVVQKLIGEFKKAKAQSAVISVDTSKAEVARAAIHAGAVIVNDVTGGRGDKEMMPLVAETKTALIIMHMKGDPRTMQVAPRYVDVVAAVADFFRQQYDSAIECGIDPMAIAFDPGIGFGKTLAHNLELLSNLDGLRIDNRPLMIGISRKSFLGKLIGSSDLRDRLPPAIGLTALLRAQGANVFRVHDVKEHVNALRAVEALLIR
jgi:dihydropteroate synthase